MSTTPTSSRPAVQALVTLLPKAAPYRLLRAALFERLHGLAHGQLVIEDPLGRAVFGRASRDARALAASVRIHDLRAYRHIALGGDVGAAESYLQGHWSSPDLVALFRLFTRNIQLSHRLGALSDRLVNLRYQVDHWLRKNTRSGSAHNIRAHYDLGNDFFALFLDDTMTYSCGIFASPASTMHEASVAKLDRICRKLDLRPGERLLEIGTGWGSLAMHAARRYGCHVTTTTISAEQYELAGRRVREAGLADRVTLLRRDYRDLDGTYDKLVSVEMIEAVGHDYYDEFFRACSRRLTPEGLMLLQAITVPDQRYDAARRSVDVIRHFIFPGSVIPSVTALLGSITRATDLRLFHHEDITPHYALTLAAWRARFWENIERIRALGYDEPFVRLWDYYLASCEAAFAERYLGDVQMLLCKPACRREPILPAL
jgi:cyclopropane-fatty-acyl-phospholipid synthase